MYSREIRNWISFFKFFTKITNNCLQVAIQALRRFYKNKFESSNEKYLFSNT